MINSNLDSLYSDLKKLLKDYKKDVTDTYGVEVSSLTDSSIPRTETTDSILGSLQGSTLSGLEELGESKYASILQTVFGGTGFAPDYVGFGDIIDTMSAGGSQSILSKCASASVAGTFADVLNFEAERIDTAVNAVQATFTTLAKGEPAISDALSIGSSDYFLEAAGAQEAIVKEVIGVIQKTYSLVRSFDEEDYQVDHQVLIEEAAEHLVQADGLYAGLMQAVLGGAKPSKISAAFARQQLEEAEDLLTSVKLKELLEGFPNKRSIKLLGYITLLETASALLTKFGISLDTGRTNLFRHDDNPLNLYKLSAPAYRTIRCRIGQLIRDMRETGDSNNSLIYMTRERLWGLELVVLIELAKLAEKLSVDLTDEFLDGKLRIVLDELVRTECPPYDYQILVSSLDRYIKTLKRKLAYNTEPEAIVREGNSVVLHMQNWLDQHQTFAELLTQNTSSFRQSARKGIKLVKSFSRILRKSPVSASLAEELIKGNITGFYSKESTSERIASIFSDIKDILKETGGSIQDRGAALTDVIGVLEDRTRAEILLKDSLDGYPEAYKKQLLISDIPSYDFYLNN